MSTGEQLKRAVAASPGCQLVGLTEGVQTSGGTVPIGRIVCSSGWAAARLLVNLCKQDAQDPELRDLAHYLRKKAGGGDREFCAMLLDYVQQNVTFVTEQGEIFQGPAYTLAAGAGDCDDQVRIMYGVAAAGGIPCRVAFLGKPNSDGPAHVLAQFNLGGQWLWAESTLPGAELGEHPIEAAKRFGAVRPDLDPASVDVQTMGSIDGLTDKLSDLFFERLAAWEQRTGGSAEGAILLMAAESGLNPQAGAGGAAQGINQFQAATLAAQGYAGTLDSFRRMTASEQLPYTLHFWDAQERAHPGATHDPRDLYWINFLPATYRKNQPDSFILAAPGMVWHDGDRTLTGEQVIKGNKGLEAGKGFITAGDLRRAINNQKRNPNVREALTRLQAAGGKVSPSTPSAPSSPSNWQAGGFSFGAALALVLALGAGTYLATAEKKL